VLLTVLNSRILQLCSEGGYKNQKHSTKRGRVGSYELYHNVTNMWTDRHNHSYYHAQHS